jgi:hypothetical protein
MLAAFHFSNHLEDLQMELTKIEVEAVETTIAQATNGHLRELNALQLAYVGGGVGDVTLA